MTKQIIVHSVGDLVTALVEGRCVKVVVAAVDVEAELFWGTHTAYFIKRLYKFDANGVAIASCNWVGHESLRQLDYTGDIFVLVRECAECGKDVSKNVIPETEYWDMVSNHENNVRDGVHYVFSNNSYCAHCADEEVEVDDE